MLSVILQIAQAAYVGSQIICGPFSITIPSAVPLKFGVSVVNRKPALPRVSLSVDVLQL